MYEIEMLGARDNIFANRSRETMIYGADVRHAHAHAHAHTNAHARGVACLVIGVRARLSARAVAQRTIHTRRTPPRPKQLAVGARSAARSVAI